MKIKLLPVLLTLLTTSSIAFDYPGLITPGTLVMHRSELALSPEQETALTGIYETAKTNAADLEEAIRTEESRLIELLRAENISEEAASTQLQKLLDAESRLKHLQLKTLVALSSELTPEQRTRALELARTTAAETAPLRAGIEAKAARLKAAFDALEIALSPKLKKRGDEIMELINRGDLNAADQALDQLILDTGLDDSSEGGVIDFSSQSPGDTDLEILKQRYEAVETAAAEVISLPLLRQLIQGRDALELAKENEDAEAVGRILTWAEGVLGL